MAERRGRVGKVVAGRYHIEEILGRGGMGVVVAARDLGCDRAVALKIPSAKARRRPELLQSFFREARITAALRSPHLVRVYDVASEPVPFMAMERLEGADLHRLLRSAHRLSPERAAGIVLQSIEALRGVHAACIVHRDLKPSNLFVCTRDERIKLLDFGVAKLPPALSSASGACGRSLIGTLQYMAPEQMLRPDEVDARADVWSLGVILYELLTGERPFAGATLGKLARKVRYLEPLAPRRLCQEIPPDLERVVLRCLQKDRDARYPGVDELARGLEPFCTPRAGVLQARRCYRLGRVERVRAVL